MQFEDRADAVAKLGFTMRQARFLVTVMLHSGVCLQRQPLTRQRRSDPRSGMRGTRLRLGSGCPCH